MAASVAHAWVLHLSDSVRVAIGIQEMIYVMPEEPTTYPVPRTPSHAQRVLVWEKKLIALLDLHKYLTQTNAPAAPRMVGIVTCAVPNTDEVAFGGLLMSRPPQRVEVTDAQACELPAQQRKLGSIAASCFRHPTYGPVPILDLPALLTRA